ncbi:hypothetical protein [Gemmatimonas sp.]|uniref:hypothetical protein n=1 Tax=Gemmatimonas sp. TaxID=1962908 RepID=UPI00333E7353
MTHLLRKGRMCPPASFVAAPSSAHRARSLVFSLLAVSGVSAALPSQPLAAQTSGRPEAPLALRVPASARYAALANAGVSGNDADVIFYNPGMLAQARGMAVSVQRFGSQATSGSFGSVQALGAFTIGVGVQTLDYGAPAAGGLEAAVRTGAPRLSDGGPVSASSNVFVLGAARTIKGFRLGANVKYAEERLGGSRDGVAALDVGMNRPLGPATIGVSVQNIGAGPQIGGIDGSLQTRVTIGYGGGLFPIWERFDIGMQSQLSVERDGFVRPAGGVELGYVPVEGVSFIIRQGVRMPRERDESLVTGGFGVTVDRFSFDYAFDPVRGGRPVSHRVGIRVK